MRMNHIKDRLVDIHLPFIPVKVGYGDVIFIGSHETLTLTQYCFEIIHSNSSGINNANGLVFFVGKNREFLMQNPAFPLIIGLESKVKLNWEKIGNHEILLERINEQISKPVPDYILIDGLELIFNGEFYKISEELDQFLNSLRLTCKARRIPLIVTVKQLVGESGLTHGIPLLMNFDTAVVQLQAINLVSFRTPYSHLDDKGKEITNLAATMNVYQLEKNLYIKEPINFYVNTRDGIFYPKED